MSRARHERLQEIFEAVDALPEGARAAALDRECAGDAALRAEVEQLLEDASRSDALADDAIERGAHLAPLDGGGAGVGASGARSGNAADDSAPELVPGFRIVRLLGEGGMGAVYEAEQDRPRRRVALKVIRSSLVTETMRRRFAREAEALGRLKHPGIAQVYSVGVGDEGGDEQPYLAMELVEGVPVTAHAQKRDLSRRARLELAAQLCDAVEHAHQRGVIHRDLKPANVLVDDAGQPKILDFGIARLTDGDVMLASLQTQVGEIVGTAAYMSPEQASGNPDDLDTRSDVYSLGVLVYELLCGRLPVEVDRLPLPDAIRAIREVEATRIGTIDTQFRGDVETILAKALDHDKARRYQSASELGADIRRFLGNEPIVARPPSTIYQLRKFARRNRLLVGATGAILVALTVGLAATAVALGREATARAGAEEALERSRASTDFLEQVLLGLGPDEARGRDTALLELMLDDAEEKLDDAAHPAVRAEMTAIVGSVRHGIFDYDRAAELFAASEELYATLGDEYAERPERTRLKYADALMKSGRRIEAADMLVAAVDHFAERDDVPNQLQAMRQLAELRMDAGAWEDALELIERSLFIGDEDSGLEDVERGRMNMMHGAILRRLRRLEDARVAYERALEHYGEEENEIERSSVLNSLGLLARDEGRLEEAERSCRASLALRRSVDPRPNPAVAAQLSNLGQMLEKLDRLEEAADVLEESLRMHEVVSGEQHFTVAYPAVRLGVVYSRQGRHEEALPLMERGLELMERQFGRAHPVFVSMLSSHGDALRRAGRVDTSIAAFTQCIELTGDLPGNQTSLDVTVRIGLAESLREAGRPAEAVAALEPALERADLPADDAVRVRALRTVIMLEMDADGG